MAWLKRAVAVLMVAGVIGAGFAGVAQGAEKPPFVYVSGYDPAILCFTFDAEKGELTQVSSSEGGKNPSYLAVSPNHKFMYAVNEADGGGAVTSFAVAADNGALTKINTNTSGGKGPCHVSVHPSGKWVFAANYGSGHICCLPVKDDGSLGDPSCTLQPGKNAHQALTSPDGKFVYLPLLGTNVVEMFSFNATSGVLTPNDPATITQPEGAGPRHLALHPNGKYAYVINELGDSITACKLDSEKGLLSDGVTQSTIPADFDGKKNSCAHVVVSPDGKFVYGSNRGHNSIAIFKVNPDNGALTFVAHETAGGEIAIPRDFTLDPGGNWMLVANQKSNNVTILKVDKDTGLLKKTGTVAAGKGPSFVGFVTR